MTEYIDANRHEVQEQDLQELLRFQQLATPAEEEPTSKFGCQRFSDNLRYRVFCIQRTWHQ